jgi:hypothetical protein
MAQLRLVIAVVLCLVAGISSDTSSAQQTVPTAPPAASSRLDLTEFANTQKMNDFIGFSDAGRDAASLATLLSAALIRANQQDQAWLLLGSQGIIPHEDYDKNLFIRGFAVITDLVEIDAKDKPTGSFADEVTHLSALDFFNKDSALAMISTMIEGKPNARYRVVGFWVNDVGKGQVQTTQRASKEQWQALMSAGDKAPPLQVLKNTSFIKPHITALVYEYQASAIKGGAPTFVPKGDSVTKHLKASGMWSALGLK